MNYLDVALAARAHCNGRALRTALYRHRRLEPRPLAIVAFQLGGEPFAPAALGWGERHDRPHFSVAGDPRNRDLSFRALLELAHWFNPRFEIHADDREAFTRGEYTFTRARTAPQVVVCNSATAQLLGMLGRRLAYLPTAGPRPVDETLVRFGRHLRFLWSHWFVPGQQLLLSLTDLLNRHWMTSQSTMERQSLSAFDAFINPPGEKHGYEAAAAVEDQSVGPVPDSDEDQRLEPLVERFNKRRDGSTAPSVVQPLLAPIENHYRPLVTHAWDLLWRCQDREARIPQAASVERRWDKDRDAYTGHMDWMASGGLRRTRQTPRQAAMMLRDLEEAQRLLEAEEACDDPLRMVPYLLQHKAVRGQVVSIDLEHRERATRSMVRRPLVQLRSPDAYLMPIGKKLWWTEQPGGREFVVEAIEAAPGNGALVTLKLMTSSGTALVPKVGSEACFSIHHTHAAPFLILPREVPWTHESIQAPIPLMSIEEFDSGR